MYTVNEFSIADARRFLKYKRSGSYETGFDLKAFDELWILNEHQFKSGEKVLDVGCGYSRFPIHLADQYECEVWAVDDFGYSSGEDFWKRGKEPQEHSKKYPQVKFVFERLGNREQSSLPPGYFDCIYSVSTLEHVPPEMTQQVWQHMDALLKSGGELLHAVDLRLPTQRGAVSIMKAFALDYFSFLLPSNYRLLNVLYTPKCYLAQVRKSLGTNIPIPTKQLNPLKVALDPTTVLEPIEWAYNRMVKDGMTEVPIIRTTSLLLHMKKSSAT